MSENGGIASPRLHTATCSFSPSLGIVQLPQLSHKVPPFYGIVSRRNAYQKRCVQLVNVKIERRKKFLPFCAFARHRFLLPPSLLHFTLYLIFRHITLFHSLRGTAHFRRGGVLSQGLSAIFLTRLLHRQITFVVMAKSKINFKFMSGTLIQG